MENKEEPLTWKTLLSYLVSALVVAVFYLALGVGLIILAVFLGKLFGLFAGWMFMLVLKITGYY